MRATAGQTNKSAIQRHSNRINRKPRQKKPLNWTDEGKCAVKTNDLKLNTDFAVSFALISLRATSVYIYTAKITKNRNVGWERSNDTTY